MFEEGKKDPDRSILVAGFWVVAAGFVAILLIAGGLLQSYLAARTNSFQSLVDKINEQNAKLDVIYEDLQDLCGYQDDDYSNVQSIKATASNQAGRTTR